MPTSESSPALLALDEATARLEVARHEVAEALRMRERAIIRCIDSGELHKTVAGRAGLSTASIRAILRKQES